MDSEAKHAGDDTGSKAFPFPGETEDALLRQLVVENDKVLEAIACQNKLLENILERQNEFVTKQDLKMMEDKIVSKIERAIPAIVKILLDAIRVKASQPNVFGHNKFARRIIKDVKEQIAELEKSLKNA